MQKLASKHKGKCLSTEYINRHSKLEWACEKGHTWSTAPKYILDGSWCPKCVHESLLKTKEDMVKLASKNGGILLSTKYINAKTKLKWQCKNGHIWETNPDNVKKGSWCPFCNKNYLSLEICRKMAESRDGKFLSQTYKNQLTPYLWQCKHGHTWKTTTMVIRRGAWCPDCARTEMGLNSRKYLISDLQVYAKKKGGLLLSRQYTLAKIKYDWKCKKGHTWKTAWCQMKITESWCPVCNDSKMETYCRQILERKLKTLFPKKRPDWLRNDRGYLLELDGYSEKLALAFEYNGEQHDKRIVYFHKTENALLTQKKNDYIKILTCLNKRVYLITIPFFVPANKLEMFIQAHLNNYNKLKNDQALYDAWFKI